MTKTATCLLAFLILSCLPNALHAQTTLDGPLTVVGGGPDILIQGSSKFRSDADSIIWPKRNFRFLLDSDNNQPGGELSIYRDVSSSAGATAGVHFSLGTGDSWLSIDGKLGIGTTSPETKLTVNGTITTKEVIVTQTSTSWPDFVFEDGYQLMPLDELATRIAQQGHLPGIPTARDVTRDGINVGDMQAKLLQKVEELTLYMIELKKENDKLRSRLESMESSSGQ